MAKAERSSGRLEEIRGFIGGLYGPDLHAKRVDALADATLGVMTGALGLPPGYGGVGSEHHAAARMVTPSMLARASAGVR